MHSSRHDYVGHVGLSRISTVWHRSAASSFTVTSVQPRQKIQLCLLPAAATRSPEPGAGSPNPNLMTHAQLVEKAVHCLRRYRCGVVLSEQACVSGEMPDALGWKRACPSVLVRCKVTRADFLADPAKAFRLKREQGVGCERLYLVPAGDRK